MPASDRDYFFRRCPRLYGHRGAAGLAPENTLPSFRRACEDGVGYLELDVHATRDGVVVVIHDATLERTTDGAGEVRSLSFAELCCHDAGHRFERDGEYPFRNCGVRVPSLEELIEALPGMPLNIEIKQAEPAIEERVVELLERCDALSRVVLAAEDHAVMQRIRKAAPDAATSASYAETREFFERCFVGSLDGFCSPARALQIPPRFEAFELVTAETLAAAHQLGLEMHVWTINDEAEMESLLRLGVDGLMSDFPDRLVSVASKLGMR